MPTWAATPPDSPPSARPSALAVLPVLDMRLDAVVAPPYPDRTYCLTARLRDRPSPFRAKSPRLRRVPVHRWDWASGETGCGAAGASGDAGASPSPGGGGESAQGGIIGPFAGGPPLLWEVPIYLRFLEMMAAFTCLLVSPTSHALSTSRAHGWSPILGTMLGRI